MKLLHSLFIVLFVTTSVFAENEVVNGMVSANDYIVNYDQAINQANKMSKITVAFPTFIPRPTKGEKLFASVDEHAQQYGFEYMIYIDSSSSCHGVKYCNIGIIAARKTDKIEMMRNRENKMITTPVMLADGLTAYFTPAHAMGDFVPATMQWVEKKTAYMISWSVNKASYPKTRDFLITMTNSAKHPGSG